MKFEWDRHKDAANRSKHRVAFSEAATVFADPLAWTIVDPDPDVAAVFHDSAVANQALREYLEEHGEPPKVEHAP